MTVCIPCLNPFSKCIQNRKFCSCSSGSMTLLSNLFNKFIYFSSLKPSRWIQTFSNIYFFKIFETIMMGSSLFIIIFLFFLFLNVLRVPLISRLPPLHVLCLVCSFQGSSLAPVVSYAKRNVGASPTVLNLL